LPVNVKFGRNSGIFVIAAIRDERQKWSMEMIMSKSKPITLGAAIFYGGLIAGILDAADGFVAYYLAAGLNPIQVLQFIASGFYGAAAFEKGNSRRLGWSPRPFFHRRRGRRHLRGSNPVSAYAKQEGGNVGHDLRRRAVHCYELCRTTAHSGREITLVFAALAERGSRARFVRWLTDRPGSPTHYEPVQLQYSGGSTIKLIGTTHRGTWLGAGQRASGNKGLGRILSNPHEFLSSRKVLDYMIETLLQTNADYVSAFLRIIVVEVPERPQLAPQDFFWNGEVVATQHIKVLVTEG
jgi:hypothetical protein